MRRVKRRPPGKRIRPRAIRRIFGHFAPHLRPYRRRLLLAGLYMLGASAMQLLRPWPLKVIFDGVLVPDEATQRTLQAVPLLGGNTKLLLAGIVLAILVIALLGGLFRFGESLLAASVGQKVVARVRYDLFRHIQRLSHTFHDTSSLGDLLARLTGDIHRIRNLMVSSGIYLADHSLVLVGMLVVMLAMDWRLTLVALVVAPLLGLAVVRFTGAIKGATRRQRRKESQITSAMTEKLSSIKVVQAFTREAHEERQFARGNDSSTRASLKTKRLEGQLGRAVELVLAIGTAGVAWFGVLRVQAGALTPGDLLVFFAYLGALYKPIRRLASLTTRIAKATVSGERVASILEIAPEVQDAPDAVAAPPLRGDIVFAGVVFRYKDAETVLEGAGFRIPAGQTAALVGESGSGKSTVADLLLRFYDPVAGRILIDGTDIRAFRQESLRQQISVVLQEAVLFDASIRENIAYGDLDASEEAIVAAAKAANLHEVIMGFADGYDTVVGERGANLSGGERQRVAIARAFVRDAPILILDEPMSHLDSASKEKIDSALEDLRAGRTCLYITHDLEAARRADLVLALRDGRIEEAAPYAVAAERVAAGGQA